jgi:uracil-DNA glycosylase family protein
MLRELRDEAASCTRCDLYRRATQTVFGEGGAGATIMLLGEQPGDQEDKQGHPFVGPAGRLLDRALDEAGIDRSDVYVTNAVKHFKWTERGKRRIHQRPSGSEIRACGYWLDAELGAVRPRLVVLLGAVAGEAIFGSKYRVGEHKGKAEEASLGSWHGLVTGTIHPSAVLRGPDPESRDRAYAGLVADLGVARDAAARATAR